MIQIVRATREGIDTVMNIRIKMLMDVNKLSREAFDEDFKNLTKSFFMNGNQTTVLAMDEGTPIGCATICYLSVLPTFGHPTGKRAHIQNVFTQDSYRRQGIAKMMIEFLISEAAENGVTHLNLDASKEGRPLYYKLGFSDSEEGMELNLRHKR